MDNTSNSNLNNEVIGLQAYEYIVNHIDSIEDNINELVNNITKVDIKGQFSVSTARYLNAVDKDKYAEAIDLLIKSAIEKDREHVYLHDLASAIWGKDYADRAESLSAVNDNFRRIYKRLNPKGF
ncbi:MAG: hypothetical protein KBT10_01210 [Bacteroidales bacterium]|nr:hypothetical protein [Candidatus Sodaliphilus aphodohippi]